MTSPKRKPLSLGPGTLTFGQVGTELDVSCQVTAASIEWEADAEDSMPTLCGGTIAGERTYSATLKATLFQDVELDGSVDWTWKNAGAEVPFTFTPRTDTPSAKVAGVVTVDPITLGGDVNKRNTSDLEWSCVGRPTFTPDDTGDTQPAG
ncbi:major tail protein [Gordonia phage Schiebs]|nr:major tail protein [Gordonia phage Schiebs]